MSDESSCPLLCFAGPGDLAMLFRWRNDPWIVSCSTSRKQVGWEEHVAWFASALDRSRHLLFILHHAPDGPVGTLRIDLCDAETAEVSVYLLEPFTGRGLGPLAIEAGSRAACEHWPALKRLVAYIRSDNRPSIRAFTRCLFCGDDTGPPAPEGHLRFVRRRCGDGALAQVAPAAERRKSAPAAAAGQPIYQGCAEQQNYRGKAFREPEGEGA